ncbi:MAG TPA: vWA domain-containing protein [Actinocrinis sp.]|nr:vWA domain-containing protein [Actinocrinis sp.]
MATRRRGARTSAARPSAAGRRVGARRRALGAVGTAFAAAVFLAAAAGPGASPLASPDLRAAGSSADAVSPADILDSLNLQAAPTSYVILVDVSGSMLADGLFSKVRSDFPDLISQFGPNDDVAVDTFGDEPETLRALGPVDQGANPAHALDDVRIDPNAATDTGGALQLAYNQLSGPTADPTKVGVVLLLTDGKPDPPASSSFYLQGINSLSDSAALSAAIRDSGPWQGLRTDFAKLSPQMTVLGCGLALQSGLDLSPVVGFVFADPLVDDQPQVPTVHSFVQQAQTAAQTKQAASVLAADSGAGVTAQITAPGGASWQDYPIGSGTASATVTFTANSKNVPLQVSDARLSASGGLTVSASGLPASFAVTPGHPVTFPVTLTWPQPDAGSMGGGTKPISANLTVAGTVSSPWAATIVSSFDQSYLPGSVTGSSATLSGTVRSPIDLVSWALWIVVIAAFAACGWLWFLSTHKKLRGRIVIGAGGAFASVPLPDARRAVFESVEVGGESAKVVVHSARRKRGGKPALYVRCVPAGSRPPGSGGRCEWSGSLILAGSWQFQHRPTAEAEQPV